MKSSRSVILCQLITHIQVDEVVKVIVEVVEVIVEVMGVVEVIS